MDVASRSAVLYCKVTIPKLAFDYEIEDFGGLRAMVEWFIEQEGIREVISWGDTPELIAVTFPFLMEEPSRANGGTHA